MPDNIFIIKKDDDKYDILCNLWRLIFSQISWMDRRGFRKDLLSRFSDRDNYFNALDLAKEFCKKIDYELVEESKDA